MSVSITHTTAATGTDDPTKQISKNAWNEAHTVTGLAASATTDTTDAGNITSGTLGAARLPIAGATTLGAVMATANPGSQFVNGVNVDGSLSYATPSGGGNVSNSGTPTAGQIAQWTDSTTIEGNTVSGDGTIDSTGALSVTKTGGVAFATSATTDTTNAGNISSGTLAAARGGAGTVNGIMKANGSGTVSAATSGTDYAAAGAATGSGLTMATARLLGRTTASSGAIEEISVGTGLSMSAGSITASATVSSVGLSSTGSTLTVTGSPVTSSGTINADLNLANANTWTATQTFKASGVVINGATSGATTLAASATSGGTMTFPSGSGTVAILGAQTFTGVQSFAASGIKLKGSSSGLTTFTSANASSSSFTLTFPAATDTVVTLAAAQTLTNKTLTSPTLTTPALGTPASGTLTSCTGLPVSTGISGLGTGVATFLATPSSSNLATAVTDETGSGALVFATSPTLVTPVLGTPASGTLDNCTGSPTLTAPTANAYKVSASNVNAQTGTTYTLVNGDNGKVVTLSNASAITLTVPSGLTAGFSCTLVQLGAGAVTITASSTTLRNRSGLVMAGQYAQAGLFYIASDTYSVGGDLTT